MEWRPILAQGRQATRYRTEGLGGSLRTGRAILTSSSPNQLARFKRPTGAQRPNPDTPSPRTDGRRGVIELPTFPYPSGVFHMRGVYFDMKDSKTA
nr:MAG TPA: hypothetical protein [Caudoviricetes sp.]